MIKLHSVKPVIKGEVKIGGSKSESNRLLILQSLSKDKFEIENLSNSKDTELMLKAINNNSDIIDVGMAGTAMRFLTAYLSVQEGREVLLTGSDRMKKRPIGELVDALVSLGASVSYEEEEGYPPLRIKGKKLEGGKVTLNPGISSQFISALMLIAPTMSKGLVISLKGKIVSLPYINLTIQLLNKVGVVAEFNGKLINVNSSEIYSDTPIVVESDWSSASYHYSLVASAEQADVIIGSYRRDSFQGDSALADIYKHLGVETIYLQNKLRLQKSQIVNEDSIFELDLTEQPDIAQTIAVTCLNIGRSCFLKGLETLKIKETDRLLALKVELEKLGAEVEISADTLKMKVPDEIKTGVSIETYDDHRMAMAFAPIAMKTDIFIENSKVVEKSYPDFWQHLSYLGITSENI